MNHHIKRSLFKYYGVISGLVFITATVFFLLKGVTSVALAAICGGALSFAFSVQKQHLEEVKPELSRLLQQQKVQQSI